MKVDRRRFLTQAAGLCALPILGRFLPGCAGNEPQPVGAPAPATSGGAAAQEPAVAAQRLSSTLSQAADGAWIRSFSGVAAPQNLEVVVDGQKRQIFDLFPSPSCPFGINTQAQLGDGGYRLSIVDRAANGQVPSGAGALRPLNMIPFGVAIDGVMLDPSGPWFDGGKPDPNNPFDRTCSGWEYDPIFATVAALVGVPAEVRGHVQPGEGGRRGSRGLFHYHGAPRAMLANLRRSLTAAERDQPLIVGYSADGFAILDAVVPAAATRSGKRLHLFSGYVLRSGARSALPHTNPSLVPPGAYDGTFVQDWVYDPAAKRAAIEAALSASGDYLGLGAADLAAGRAEYAVLDSRNGLTSDGLAIPGVTRTTYLYVLTPDWPEIPRWFALEPSESFRAVIPFDSKGAGPPGRKQLYDACPASLADVHQWDGRAPY